MTLTFPGTADVVFEDAPLQSVLCQVRFPPIYALLGDTGVVGFQEALRRDYPTSGKSDGAALALGPGGLQATKQPPVWTFTSDDNRWIASIAVDFIALETPAYLHFSEFLDRFEHLLDVVNRTLHPDSATRIGLRKINEFVHPEVALPSDWSRFLNPQLLGLLGSSDLLGSVQLGLADVRLGDSRGDTFGIRHGVMPSDDATPDNNRKYLLDLDYYSERSYEVVSGSGLAELLGEFSGSISSFFNWCLLPAMFDFLRPQPRPGGTS